MPVLDAPAWTPSVDQVALHLLARTRIANGTYAGTFNDSTEPTGAQVAGVIAQACQLIAPRLGPVPEALTDSAQAVAALKAAIQVERSFFMEQVAQGLSPEATLMTDYKAALCDWDMAARGEQPNGLKVTSLSIGTLYSTYPQ
jgi:hypothetical protein